MQPSPQIFQEKMFLYVKLRSSDFWTLSPVLGICWLQV